MSDPVQSSEIIFKKQATKFSFSIYGVNNTKFEETFKPQDVISCVNTQLKAYQVADTIKTVNKRSSKELMKYKHCEFLNVTKLPIYVKTPYDLKFNTQGVTDSELRNIIETAEILEAHQGMTQEFETDFVQDNTENEQHCLISEMPSATNLEKHVKKDYLNNDNDSNKTLILNNNESKEINNKINTKHCNSSELNINSGDTNIEVNKDKSLNSIENIDDTEIQASQILTSKSIKSNKIHKIKVKSDFKQINNEKYSVANNDKSAIIAKGISSTSGKDIEASEYCTKNSVDDNNLKEINKEYFYLIEKSHNDISCSQIIGTKITRKRKIIDTELHIENNKLDTQCEISNQMLNQSEETQNDEVDAPASPIFPNNIVKQISNTSPLIFNLDNFEYFESIANPIIETLDFETAKHVINSQILNKELSIKNDEINLHNKDNDNVLITTVNDLTQAESFNKNAKFKERDKNSEDVLNQECNTVNEKVTIIDEHSTDILKDEILFSSDEEEYNASHEQDLPFTCALETSFHDQVDVLDETVYVGFQTASNRSIQVLANSFAKAKSLLNDVISDDITVTDLVTNIKHNTSTEKSKRNLIEQTNPDLSVSKKIDIVTEAQLGNTNIKRNQFAKPPVVETGKFIGFKTANNKDITLSENSLVRYKKVFQDIDLTEDFKSTEKALPCHSDANEMNMINESYCQNNKLENVNTAIDVLQGIDDKILQDFDNIDMTLDNNKKENIETVHNVDECCYVTDKSFDKSSELREIRNTKTTFNLIVNEMNIGETKIDGFKTASNKNINISKKSWAKSKSVFENIDEIQINDTTFKQKPKFMKLSTTAREPAVNSLPSTSKEVVSFRTASNKYIKISEKAMFDTKKVFNDIDSTELPNKVTKGYPKTSIDNENKYLNMKKTKYSFDNKFKVPKAVNKEHIENSTAKETMVPNINLNNSGLKTYPQQIANEHEIDYQTTKRADVINEPTNNSKVPHEFNGFKTASNKIIMVSHETLSKTKNIFNDIDLIDFKPLNRNKSEYPDLDKCNYFERDKHLYITDLNDQNSKISNNKYNKISTEAIIETKHTLKSIENNFEDKINNQNPLSKGLDNCNDKRKARSTSPVFKGIKSEKENAENILENKILKSFNKEHRISNFTGFLTANNKQVNVSENALFTSRKTLNDNGNRNEELKLLNSKQTNEQDNKDVNKTDINSATDNNKYNSNRDGPSISHNNFISFKTANNNVIKISDETLSWTKNVFKDIEFNVSKNKMEYPAAVVTTNTSYKEVDRIVNDDKLKDFQVPFNANAINSSDILIESDLSEYTNHNLDYEKKISDTSAKDIKSNDNLENRSISPVFRGFQTGNNEPVTMSDKALKKSKELFIDLDKKITINTPLTGFVGFQTASNKKVTISEKALEDSKRMFKDIDSISTDFNNLKSKTLYPKEIYQNENIDDIEILINKDIEIKPTFKGFHTASSKPISISKNALDKSKKLFKDIENQEKISTLTENKKEIDLDKLKKNSFKGFQTGNNKTIKVSEEALAKSKQLFSEIDFDINEPLIEKDKKEISNIEDINALIDTQIINNFNQSLYTDDFRESPERSKRSGSPILSCPRVKKRKKFETPYNFNTIKPTTNTKKTIKQSKIIYRDDYKKSKKYNLKDITKYIDNKIDSFKLQFNYDNLLDFQFNKERNELSDEIISINILKKDFMDSVNFKLVPDGWVDNHLKLILWKLMSYEIKFKIIFCTVKNVLEQLKYRYDRELYNAERPALRKILERDDVPGKTLILCVADIYADGVKLSSITETSNIELLVTDGWYCVRCTIDKMLIELVRNKKIVIGTKLVTCGAELLGCDQGVSPWEDTSTVRLKIFGNSTRRARWDAKLGYYGNSAILSQLSSVKVLGGKVSKLHVFVTRVYPALYVEKFEDGSTVTRSERLENLHQMKMESARQVFIEKICEEVEKEFVDQDAENSEGFIDSSKRTCMESGSQIAKMMRRSKDPVEFTAQLSHTQTRLLEEHTTKNRDRLIQEMQVRVREKIDKAGVCVNRNVICLLKIRIAGFRMIGDKVEVTKGIMSIWKPTDNVRELLKEGAWINVMNVVPTALRLGEIQISAGRQSLFSASKFKPLDKFKPYTNSLQRKCYKIENLTQNAAISTDYNEIDTIGFIFLIDPDIDIFDPAKQSFQNVYLSDADCNIICIHFWGGLKKFGYQNILDTGQIVFCGNLQKRAGNSRKNIPQFRVTELSYFTQTPRSDDARDIFVEFNNKISSLNIKEYCQKCIVLKNNYSVIKQNNENVSPYRGLNNSDINLSKNKIFIDSPLVRPKQEDFNFSGMDFESTFKQDTELSVEVLKRKRKINEKIAKLEMCGEPPPLTNINIINKSKKVSSSYKSPLLSENIKKSDKTPNSEFLNTPKSIQISNTNSKNDSDVSENVATVKTSPRNRENDRLIALNRTYVKCLNPVKNNFDMPNEDKIDPFAEEFDVSPPLSLDDYSI